MNRRRLLTILAVLVGGGFLIWLGWSRSRSIPTQETPASMKAMTQPTEDLMSLLKEQANEYVVQAGDSLYKIARQHHTTVDLLKQLNGLESDLIRAGQKLKVPPGQFDVVVSLLGNQLALRLNGKPLKTYTISTGKDRSTPMGDFTIVTRLKDPIWYKTGAVIPPDSPDNILGSRWLGISSKDYPKGYGIHGTIEPDKIGETVTAGCVRMRNEEVEELYTLLPEGTPVRIVERET